MASNLAVTDLASIKPFKTVWKVQIKIIHSWQQYTSYSGETLEMVLADVSGTLIHATVKKQQLHKFQRMIVPGQWRIIEDFSLTKATGKFRVTKHAYRMFLLNTSIIVPCASLSDDIYLHLVDFQTIHNEPSLNENILIDVIGQVVNVGEMKTHEVDNKFKKKLEFELKDTRDERLACTLWGKFAENMLAACENNRLNRLICLLRFAKVNSLKGQRSVSNAFEMSLLLIDPALPPIAYFLANLPNDGLALTIQQVGPKEDPKVKKAESYKRVPAKTIAELLEYKQEGKFRIMCAVYAIDTEFAWYYFVCSKCNTTCYNVPKEENEDLKKNKKTMFWCSGCNNNHSNVEPRFRLILCVMDSTAQTKFMLFENHAYSLIQQSSLQLLNGHFDEIVDPKNIPKEIQNLVGKTFQFVVSIEKDNIKEGSDTYKVGHVFVGLEVEEDDTIEHSVGDDDLTTLVSANKWLRQCRHSISFHYTFSKRKDDESDDTSNNSSSSKQACLGSITRAIEDEHVDDDGRSLRSG
ncbi:PREDICTED: uncharacterized protein LOC104738071 [Camelina sativa]|uniref:Uncharacterized protein LOC104738071 n=1 Tax=Camelina sativa TaxID=90675 RepID=A0ABM0VIB3_CAMSA|nr:PREDICTED: uncharacterized protein LOC104738071 [Camelina sativa]